MKRLFTLFCCLCGGIMIAQNLNISGRVTDASQLPLSFVNVLVYKADAETPSQGTTTDEDGSFIFKGLVAGTYKLNFSYIGFENTEQTIELSSNKNLGNIVLKESSETLGETVVTAKLPTIKKTTGKLVFNVENTSLSVGSTMDLLKKTPGVVVIGENIQIKFSSPVTYINGKRVYLSAAEVTSLLENTDAANIKSIEVITNPTAKYDADAATVLNIITSKPISIGYKGSLNTTYTQGIYPKYSFGTSHFYKNNWLNLYASYNYNTNKQYKEDESYIRYFKPDEVSTKSIWETYFNRTTNSENHTGNLVLDFTLDDKNSLSLTSNISMAPDNTYHNNGHAYIYNPQKQLDSINTTLSEVNYKKDNLAFALDYQRKLNDNGATLSAAANYIYYNHRQDQSVSSDYFLPDNDFLRNNSFFTNSAQNSNIFTGQTDVSANLWEGTFTAGFKFSNIDTESKINFFDTENNIDTFNDALSDNFNYKENIYAEYINYEKEWEKWSITAGIRGEYTDINGISRTVGEVNTQTYFEIFPSASVNYNINDNNSIGIGYNRSIHRPRYESLNPFKYFITENNFIAGNPHLVPSIKDKITLSYSHKNKWFFDLYYENIKNGLGSLSFQNNENSTLRSVYDNLVNEYQYSFDIGFYSSLTSWWYFHLSTSSYYLSNKFNALESSQDAYTNDTFGQYLQTYNNFTLSKDRSFTADITALYISNFVFGNRYFKNQSFVNISFRKEFWDKRASLTVGVDDIFNTLNNVASTTKYYNQDNQFLVNQENRLFRIGFKYNLGNARLRDNKKNINIDEGDRLGDE
ncbi:TonB-dependent receptor domain-containing protein [Aequorivita sp. CIP111184]|uniref:TonB-dependent receptor domain-containing protein n=1 Tax=Aequorivita sp. CIP111184 TaxID=2211356 RepID=UPI000DCFD7A3|nr:TonB-dependent receptor [Aequorivita sp. CIP111184]